jgi:dolichol-phosphate mannosyltransferase
MPDLAPELSLVVPCFNEQETAEPTLCELLAAFGAAGIALELVACDNGSTDGTGEILAALAAREPAVVLHRVARNRGYGFGILDALPRCRAAWVGYLPADGQVAAEDVVRLFERVRAAGAGTIGKVRRRRRPDGATRVVVSRLYNTLMALLWPGLAAGDLNGIPKLLHRDDLAALRLASHDWMLDPELMIKARDLGLRVVELDVVARPRRGGRSKVVPRDVAVFLARIAAFRWGGELAGWRRQTRLAEATRRARR